MHIKLLSALALVLLTLACQTTPPTPAPDISATVTALIEEQMAAATAQPTYTPHPTSTQLPTSTPYPTPTPLPTYTPIPTPTNTPTPTPTPTPTATPTPTPTATPLPTATPTPTATATPTPRPTATPTATPRPTATPVPTPTPAQTQWQTYENLRFRYDIGIPPHWLHEVEDGGRLVRIRTKDWNALVNIYIPDYRISNAKSRLQQFADSQTESNHLFELFELEDYRYGDIYGARFTARSQWKVTSCIQDRYEYLLTKDGSFYWWISLDVCGYADDTTMWEIFESMLLY